MLKRLFFGLGLWSVLVLPVWAASPTSKPLPHLSDTLSDTFIKNVSTLIDQLTASSSELGQWSQNLMLFLTFVALFFEIVKFIQQPAFEEHLQAVIWVILTGILWANYSHVVDNAWNLSNAIAGAIKKTATGSSDPFFLSEFTARAMKNIVMEHSDGLFGSVVGFFISAVFFFLTGVFEAVMYLADMWGIWGSAVAKILGVLFVPLMIFEKTRPVFDGWVRFFCGFLILNVILAITGVISAITLQSLLQQVGYMACLSHSVSICLDQKFTAVVAQQAQFGPDLLIVLFLCIILIVSSFGFAKTLAQSIGGVSAGASQGVKSAAARLATKFL